MILTEDTTPEEVSEFILGATEDEINEALTDNKTDVYLRNLSDEAKVKLLELNKTRLRKHFDNIIDIMKKGGYENL